MVSMKRLSQADRVRVIKSLVDGCGIRATVRITGIAKNTIAKLIVDLGKVCASGGMTGGMKHAERARFSELCALLRRIDEGIMTGAISGPQCPS
jgi:hypothetical protein